MDILLNWVQGFKRSKVKVTVTRVTLSILPPIPGLNEPFQHRRRAFREQHIETTYRSTDLTVHRKTDCTITTRCRPMSLGYGDARHTPIQPWSWTLGILEAHDQWQQRSKKLLLAEKYAYV